MKRVIFLVMTVFSLAITNGQNITDALRYSTESLNGTARFNSLSGAFGALGGDVSSIVVNPAGSSVFLNSVGTITVSVVDKKNKATYFNTTTSTSDANFKFNQLGFVFVLRNPNPESSFNKFTMGLNYIATQNFDENLFVRGTGNTSISEFFLAQAQGVPLNLLQLQSGETISSLYSYLGETEGVAAQNAFLGYQGFIIDPIDPDNPSNTQYYSTIAPGNYYQEYSYYTSGYSGKYTFNLATQLNRNISLGVNLNSNNIDYRQTTFLYETNSNQGSLVNNVGFENNLAVYGWGFSAQFGAIAKVTNSLRVGLTYDTPIWYDIYEETIQYLDTQRNQNGNTINEIIDPRIVNIFQKYELRTPWKVSGSAAYVFGKQGLISFDYVYKDYSSIQFGPSHDPVFAAENNRIKSELKGASIYRIGGEYRIDLLSIRGGYVFEESPYKNTTTLGDLTGFSFGFGYFLGSYNIDLSYSRTQQDRKQQLYDVGLTDVASINTSRNNYVLTIAYEIN